MITLRLISMLSITDRTMVDFRGRIIEGEIHSGTARKLIRQWAQQHEMELAINWKRAKALQRLEKIAPLE